MWVSGSISDNVRELLISFGITYTNTFGGEIFANLYHIGRWAKVFAVRTNGDFYDVYIDEEATA